MITFPQVIVMKQRKSRPVCNLRLSCEPVCLLSKSETYVIIIYENIKGGSIMNKASLNATALKFMQSQYSGSSGNGCGGGAPN